MSEWRDIQNWPEYQVSDDGQVRSLHFGRERLLSLGSDRRYARVKLSTNGQTATFQVGRLVLLAFVGTPPVSKPLACHLDDNGWNNKLRNLYWGSNKENIEDALLNGGRRIGNSHPNAVFVSDDIVAKIKAEHVPGLKGIKGKTEPRPGSTKWLADKYNISHNIVKDITSGKWRVQGQAAYAIALSKK